jgi:hypothetical protein
MILLERRTGVIKNFKSFESLLDEDVTFNIGDRVKWHSNLTGTIIEMNDDYNSSPFSATRYLGIEFDENIDNVKGTIINITDN